LKPSASEEKVRKSALDRWQVIVESIGIRFLEDQSVSEDLESVVKTILRSKATLTLVKRGHDFHRLVRFVLAQPGRGWPPTVEEVKEFFLVRCLTPTSRKSVSEALRFAKHVVGIKGIDEVCSNRFLQGLVAEGLEKKGLKKQAKELEPNEIFKMEEAAINGRALRKRGWSDVEINCLFGGLVGVSLRARCSDLQRSHGMVAGADDLLESASDRSKNAQSIQFRDRVSLTGPLRMFTGSKQWVYEWDDFRAEVGMDRVLKPSISECRANPIVYPVFPAHDGRKFLPERVKASS